MEQIDPIRAQRVWQRVTGGTGTVDPLPRLYSLEQEVGQIYAQLAKAPALSSNRLLARMREESRAFLHTYAGLMALSSGAAPGKPPQHTLRGNPEGFLQRCWELRQKSLALLESAQPPAPFVPMLDELKDRTTAHCLRIPELLGWLRMHQA